MTRARENARSSVRPVPPAEPRRFTWNALLWALIYPRRTHRILPTIPGTVLVALSMGIGIAAYNSSSNILFLTVALLLTCLILSGVLSWLNFRRVSWELHVAPALRVGHDTLVALRLRNQKRYLPTYGLWFNLLARAIDAHAGYRAESTLSARGADIRAALERAEAAEIRGRVALTGRLDPANEATLEWVLRPTRRGLLRVELASVGSLFPFGFLRKDLGTGLAVDVIVWPAAIAYRREPSPPAQRQLGSERVARAGSGTDLLAVRRYTAGDSHRLIHWKASARTRQLLVRQFAAEAAEGYVLWVRTDAGIWRQEEQFEILVRLAATLGEDLFRADRLVGVAIDGGSPTPVRRLRDLELFLDALAVLRPSPHATGDRVRPAGARHVLTFSPDGARGVIASVDGQVFART